MYYFLKVKVVFLVGLMIYSQLMQTIFQPLSGIDWVSYLITYEHINRKVIPNSSRFKEKNLINFQINTQTTDLQLFI